MLTLQLIILQTIHVTEKAVHKRLGTHIPLIPLFIVKVKDDLNRTIHQARLDEP